MSSHQLRQRLDVLLAYMQPYWEFVNCHMVNYLTDKHWENFVPEKLRHEVLNVESVNDCIKTVFWQEIENEAVVCNKHVAIRNFLHESMQNRLDGFSEILTNAYDLFERSDGAQKSSILSIKEFLSEKKQHEVEITAELVDNLIKDLTKHSSEQQIFVVDAGDGKGYLSSRLALQYGHKVLGIDANEMNTENALYRSQKLGRAWNALTIRAELQSVGINQKKFGPKKSTPAKKIEILNNVQNYKTTAKFITPDLKLSEIVKHYFTESQELESIKVCLTGLHTCGNLAATCLKVFHAQSDCKILCNIGCCYHLLKESYSDREFYGNKFIMEQQTESGFPLSQYLQQKRVRLGRNARMLAAQSIERTNAAKQLTNISLFYRAMLEVLICEQNPKLKDTIQVGKIRKFENFQQYVQLCVKKSNGVLVDIDVNKIVQLEEQYANDKNYLDLFYLLRMSFAPVLETLILLDRLLYLKELGYEHSYLISLYDAVISPRHFAIVAMKV